MFAQALDKYGLTDLAFIGQQAERRRMFLDNLDKLIKLLATIAEYAPNEPELTVAGLTQLYNQLNAKTKKQKNKIIQTVSKMKRVDVDAGYFFIQDNTGNSIDPRQYIIGTDHFRKMSQELRIAEA